MARTRPGLAIAIHEILQRRGADGKRLSFRQAERLTGLSPATIAELAKGNARTADTVRRFALGMDVAEDHLLLLAGFVPEDAGPARDGARNDVPAMPDTETRVWLERWAEGMAQLPPGRARELFLDGLRREVELLETFIGRGASASAPDIGAEETTPIRESEWTTD